MAGFWGKRKREEQDAQDADLARRADRALVEADERIRVTTDELAFAEAELGPGATKDLREALESVRTHLAEAFHLNQLNHDEIPDTTEELRTRNARIVQLCEWAEGLLDDRTESLAEPIARARRAPEIIAGVRSEAVRLRSRIDGARETVQRLGSRYTTDALHQISENPGEVEQLLGFAEHSAQIAERRREAGQREQANFALEAATESVRRAATLLDAVETFEIEALRAESTLAAVIEDSRGDLVAARDAPPAAAVTTAAAELAAALSALPAAGAKTDPFTELSHLREANTALDAAIAKARDRAARPIPSLDQVRHAIDDAERQLAVARDVIAGHRGWIGADARTRLAEAERVKQEFDIALSGAWLSGPIEEDEREQALATARRVAQLASEALQLAQRDIDRSRPNDRDDGWGGGRRGGGDGGNMMGGMLGGLLLGGMLGDMFDG